MRRTGNVSEPWHPHFDTAIAVGIIIILSSIFSFVFGWGSFWTEVQETSGMFLK